MKTIMFLLKVVPENWDTQELMDCYYEVVDIKNIISTQMRATFQLKREDGIKIVVVIENNGRGITFFPNLITK